MRSTIIAVSFLMLTFLPVWGAEAQGADGPGIVHRVVAYVPNRVLDVFDLVRLRVRVGPGFAIGIRATEAADVFAGSYLSVYAGLPGPRSRRLPRLPLGLESRSGVEASLVDVSTGVGLGPDYSNTEFGLGFQAALIGVDMGLDPFEIVDLIAGIFFLDPRGDDL